HPTGETHLKVVPSHWRATQTLTSTDAFSPAPVVSILTPVFAGALGLLLARSLGIDPRLVNITGGWQRIRAIFMSTPALLRAGAWIYLLAAVAGGVVWGFNSSTTPELVTVIVLTAAGYVAATVTTLAQP
ncbi:MAG: hypothetical protein WD049_02655, partial [Candidatus Paceibacterota bacterium]